jgi:signal transduction histidine kinase
VKRWREWLRWLAWAPASPTPPRLPFLPVWLRPGLVVGPAVAGLWLLAVLQLNLSSMPGSPAAPSPGELLLVAGMHTVPLLWSWRAPLAAWLPVTGAAMIVLATWSVWPLACALALLAAVYMVGARTSRPVAVAVGTLTVLALLPMIGNPHFAGVPLLAPLVAGLVIGVLLVADNVRGRQAAEQALAEQAEQHRQEQARRALLEERSRIARELHDVVAHHMSMIAVQAETAPYRLHGLSQEARDDFAGLSATAREALTEMRRLLGVLRGDEQQAERAPQPGLARLGELVDGARRAGLPVRLTVSGQPRTLPASVDLSAYRIVQEALSNAVQHARGAQVEVELRWRPAAVEVAVTDDGRGAAGAPPAGGHGLLGMSERVAMLGGSLEVGPRPEGGFQVRAALPVEPQGSGR